MLTNTYYPAGKVQMANLFAVKQQKIYNLYYRGQLLVSNAPYAVCNGKKTALLNTGNYTKQNFTIKNTAQL